MAELSVEQTKQINNYIKTHPGVSQKDAQIALFGGKSKKATGKGVSVERTKAAPKTRSVTLKSGRKVVIKNGKTTYYASNGTALNIKYFQQKEGKVNIRPSGRYSVTQNGKTRYYAANGNEINGTHFKSVEYPDVKVKAANGKTYNLNGTLSKRINNVSGNLAKAEKENGFIGKAWSGFKNLTGIGDSSDKVRELQKQEKKLLAQFNTNPANRAKVFKQLTGVDYNKQNMEAFNKWQS